MAIAGLILILAGGEALNQALQSSIPDPQTLTQKVK